MCNNNFFGKGMHKCMRKMQKKNMHMMIIFRNIYTYHTRNETKRKIKNIVIDRYIYMDSVWMFVFVCVCSMKCIHCGSLIFKYTLFYFRIYNTQTHTHHTMIHLISFSILWSIYISRLFFFFCLCNRKRKKIYFIL